MLSSAGMLMVNSVVSCSVEVDVRKNIQGEQGEIFSSVKVDGAEFPPILTQLS